MSEIRVGLLGLGTIGVGVARLLLEHEDLLARRLGKRLKLTRICDLDISHDRGLDLSDVELTANVENITTAADIDIIIELIGGYEPAKSFVMQAINHGKHVVTANKALIAKHGEEIFEQAAGKGVVVAFEASVGGGIPCLKALREGLAGNRIESIHGILNGTCNYILTKMEDEGLPFEQVLQQAQELGYAEADPSFDVDGIDTAHKLSILAAMAFGSRLGFEGMFTEGIRCIKPADIAFANELGFRIKLLGVARPNGDNIEMRVHPTLIPLSAQLAQVQDSYNAVFIRGDFVENTFFVGRGAGERPTASAVVADILDVARVIPGDVKCLAPVMAFPEQERQQMEVMPMADVESEYYFRLMVNDHPGVLASVTEILACHRISLEAVLQKERHETRTVPVVMLTHKTTEGNLQAAMQRIIALPSVEADPLILRIERFGS